MTFRVGDIVQLRYGGGPRMKVENSVISGGTEWVTCVWGASNECHNYFAAELLQNVGARREPQTPRPAASIWDRPRSWLRS